MSEILLDVQKVSISFGGLIAVNGPAFSVRKNELFGLIGPNGAGKTTCFNLITGVYKPNSGQILFKNKRIDGLSPNKIAELGIARTFQNIRLFSHLSVLDNVAVGAYLRHKTKLMQAMAYLPSVVEETKHLKERAMFWLEALELADLAHHNSVSLPYGKQRRLEIARALATEPEILLLDEPAAGMNPHESEELAVLVRKLRDDYDLTVILIEHDMKFVMNLCNHIAVLDHGVEIAIGSPDHIRSHPKVIEAYLGQSTH
jgi:branched-chain amino acid transport system ATP-binding protein